MKKLLLMCVGILLCATVARAQPLMKVIPNSATQTALPVSGTDVDIRNLTAALDTVHVDSPILATLSDSTPTDTWYDLTLTDTGTEYSQVLPANTIAYKFQCRTSNDVRWGNTGELATTYWTLKSGASHDTFPLPNYNYSSKTLYFRSETTAGLVMEIYAIVKP